MKSLFLSALICAAGTSMAATSPATTSNKSYRSEVAADQKAADAFRKQITFHQRNIDLLWHQYEREVARIKESPGSHMELDREEAKAVRSYQQDIDNGVRVASGEKAITEISAKYAKKHAARETFENKEIAGLRDLLKTALQNEMKALEATKRKYADVENQQILSLLQEVEQYLVQSIKQVAESAGKPSASLS